ncbi:septum site-determining protein MinC [Alkalihalophilus marmarensis]|jgi:septum site-determining protein MinC|uniref:Probable septum site-determining protein MinC n=1 Tax=Alkalihalophilus marmarensis DSM 21297 TaxID=1188261 RepID=U6SM27_9BACI|nr:septum site-determining protein MinC [Alkalihalophilus marmarensis]ERN52663.1 septation inhibitor protein [Alkalihalophilus marmarensis DSM 21297]MCM3487960.1 septum site-determining protein MinC [Alkalihalophilus marmarensis]
MTQKKQHVTIKGTKDGLNFLLDDRCSYESLLEELKEKLSTKHYQGSDEPDVMVNVKVGHRYLTEGQAEEISSIITEGRNLAIEEIHSDVLTKAEAELLRQESQVVTLTKMVRSGQVLKVRGDLLLIGDVNPSGTVMATGNVYIMGALKGVAHAGFEGDTKAVVAAALMSPTQLRIADQIHQFDEGDKGVAMASAYLDSEAESFKLERVQDLMRQRPNLQKNDSQIIDG